MNKSIKFNVALISQFGKAVIIIVAGSLLVHTAVMIIDFYLTGAPLRLSLETEMGAYALFSLLVYILWNKLKKTMLLACEKEIQYKKDREVIESLQRMTGLLAEHISVHNAEIMNWIEFRKRKGQQVSERVEQACKKISLALNSLSEIAFVYPYMDNSSEYFKELEELIQNHLANIELVKKNSLYQSGGKPSPL
jgi:hypothetical protein